METLKSKRIKWKLIEYGRLRSTRLITPLSPHLGKKSVPLPIVWINFLQSKPCSWYEVQKEWKCIRQIEQWAKSTHFFSSYFISAVSNQQCHWIVSKLDRCVKSVWQQIEIEAFKYNKSLSFTMHNMPVTVRPARCSAPNKQPSSQESSLNKATNAY
jgi:hypothetical protein